MLVFGENGEFRVTKVIFGDFWVVLSSLRWQFEVVSSDLRPYEVILG